MCAVGATCVYGGDVRDDVVVVGFSCRFSRAGVMAVRFRVLSCSLFYVEEVLNDAEIFIVEYMELEFVADRLQFHVDTGEGLHHANVLLRFHSA